MKTIISGDKTISDIDLVKVAIKKVDWSISEIVSCGLDDGINSLAVRYAKEAEIPVKEFFADWDAYGKAAPAIRNKEMAKYADAVIIIIDEKSVNYGGLYSEAKELGLRVVVFLADELKEKNKSNPIKKNEIFFDGEAPFIQFNPLATKTITFNDMHFVVYENSAKNQPIVNVLVELIEEVKRLKKLVK